MSSEPYDLPLADELELNPPDRPPPELNQSPSKLDQSIDALVPRDSEPTPEVRLSREIYLSLLANLKRKHRMVEHRYAQWSLFLESAKTAFAELAARRASRTMKDLPIGASAALRLVTVDAKLESEFEALLFAVRSAADILARLVASTHQGLERMHSYNDLAKALERRHPDRRATSRVSAAKHEWFDELKQRRDSAAHYASMTVESVLLDEVTTAGERIKTQMFVHIPRRDALGKPVSVWHDFVPVVGSTSSTAQSIKLADGRSVEAHALHDNAGRMLLRRNGPLPASPETIDGEVYVRSLVNAFTSHVIDVLEDLRRDRAEAVAELHHE